MSAQIDTQAAKDAAMQAYMAQGECKALALDNRGPIRYTADGNIAPDILEAYWHYGFYVFTGAMRPEELPEIEADLNDILERLPVHEGAKVDSKGRPPLGLDCSVRTLFWSKPLADPFGGTDFGKGRHPVKMPEPDAASGAPRDIVFLIIGSLQFSEACLRATGNPDLLAVAAAVNGDDFVPYTDALFIKAPGLGASVAWHQDGVTHWDNPNWDQGTHGFNFMGQLYGCTPTNGVWVVPGSHKVGRVDIKAKVDAAGTQCLPDAIPMVCDPGDVVISNRQLLHGSFANTGKDWRVTVNMGFHRRESVLGAPSGGVLGEVRVIDAAQVEERSRTIGYAIDARRQRFPDETPYVYRPFAEAGRSLKWDSSKMPELADYHRLDLSI